MSRNNRAHPEEIERNRLVKKEFENVDIECWEHVANRRFGWKPPFICLKAGSSRSPEAILALIDELRSLGPSAQLSMKLLTSQRSNPCNKIRFLISPESETLTEMSFTKESGTANFEFTSRGLQRFREAVTQWQSGLDDFSIHPNNESVGTKDGQSGEVWFWTPSTEP